MSDANMALPGLFVRPGLCGDWAADGTLGRLLPDLLWLAESPSSEPGVEAVPLLRITPLEAGGTRTLVWREGERLRCALDLDRCVDALRGERYRPRLTPPISARVPFNYSILPNWVKGTAQSLLSHLERPKDIGFPALPFDLSADFLDAVAGRLQGRTDDGIPWPEGAELAVSVSHDVDTAWVLRHPAMMERIALMEEAHGFRSTWHLVSNYLDDARLSPALDWLASRGHELGSHGDNHDTKHPFADAAERARRWTGIKRHAKQFGMAGFRSAWLARTDEFLDELAGLGLFAYDSSVPMSSPLGVTRTNAGCAASRPYFIRPGLVELPVTVFLEELYDVDPDLVRFGKLLDGVRAAHGFVAVIMHPQPHQSANPRLLGFYEKVLAVLARLPAAWRCRQQDAAAIVAGVSIP